MTIVPCTAILITLLAGHVVRSIEVLKLYKLDGYGTILIESEQRSNWFEAWNECAMNNMTLIALDTVEKNAAVTSILRTNSLKVNLWIGGNDFAVKGHFVWASSGKPFVFTNWSKGNPDNGHDVGSCTHFWTETDFEWNDAKHVNKFGFICEDNPFIVAARKDFETRKHFIEQLLHL